MSARPFIQFSGVQKSFKVEGRQFVAVRNVSLDVQRGEIITLQTELLRLCRKLNKTVLFVTHDVDEAIALADRCVVFAGRPGTIDHIIDIPLTGERNLVQMRSDPRYVELCAELWKRLAPDVAGAADPAALAHSLEVV